MSARVIATGDSLFTADFPEAYTPLRRELDVFLRDADLRLTNLETVVSDFGGFANQYSGGTWINVRGELFPFLASFGFDFYGTANNHCMDYSYHGLCDTLDFLDAHGLAHAGTGRSLDEAASPAVLPFAEGKAAVFAVDTSMGKPSMAGKSSRVFDARPGVNFLRHETVYGVSEEELAQLKSIAKSARINFKRDLLIATGYALPEKENVFSFGDTLFTADPSVPTTKCVKRDLDRLLESIRKAKETCAYVFLLVHCHDNDGFSHAAPPAYLKEFCFQAIDAGANAIFGGGCHELRGMEVYNGCPIFYSLGDFIYQGMRVEHLPPDFMEKYGVDVNASAREGLDARSEGGKKGLQTEEKNFLTVLPRVTFESGKAAEITLMPVRLGFQTGSETLEGLPRFAQGEEGEKIFRIFQALSAPFGTSLTLENGLIRVVL